MGEDLQAEHLSGVTSLLSQPLQHELAVKLGGVVESLKDLSRERVYAIEIYGRSNMRVGRTSHERSFPFFPIRI